MLTRFEERTRYKDSLYKTVTWYFCGLPILRRWEQLTIPGRFATATERS